MLLAIAKRSCTVLKGGSAANPVTTPVTDQTAKATDKSPPKTATLQSAPKKSPPKPSVNARLLDFRRRHRRPSAGPRNNVQRRSFVPNPR